MSLSLEDNGAGFLLSSARFQPTSAFPLNRYGLVTPPESPTYNLPEDARNFPTGSSLNSCKGLCLSQSQYQSPIEAQCTHHDLSRVSETIYTIIEQVIEQKLADAMGPLRLNIRRFDSENTDLQAQNDTLGFKVGHLEQQLQTLQNISATAASNLDLISSLTQQLSEATNNLQSRRDLNSENHLLRVAAPATPYQEGFNVPPQFRFEDRNSKIQRQNSNKSKKSKLLKNIFYKWRTGGAERD